MVPSPFGEGGLERGLEGGTKGGTLHTLQEGLNSGGPARVKSVIASAVTCPTRQCMMSKVLVWTQ